MGVIMIRCPQTGREIPTGIEMDTAEFRRAPVFFSRVQCPVCAREHEWFAKDAWVCDSAGCGIRVGHIHRSIVRKSDPRKELVRRTASVGGRGERRPAPA